MIFGGFRLKTPNPEGIFISPKTHEDILIRNSTDFRFSDLQTRLITSQEHNLGYRPPRRRLQHRCFAEKLRPGCFMKSKEHHNTVQMVLNNFGRYRKNFFSPKSGFWISDPEAFFGALFKEGPAKQFQRFVQIINDLNKCNITN